MTIRFSSAVLPADHPAAIQLELFLAYRRAAGRREATLIGYERVARRFIHECPGLPPEPHDWTSDHVVRWISLRRRDAVGRHGGHLDDNTIAYDQRQLYVFLGWLYEREVIDRDPRRGLRITAGTQKHKSAMTEPDVRKLVTVAQARPIRKDSTKGLQANARRDAAIVRCLWSTGARINELAEVELADFDRKGSSLIVRHPKSRRERELPLDPQAMVVLLEYLHVRGHETGPLFKASRAAMTSMLKRLAELAGVRAAPHDFRYGFARRCLEAGMAQADVQDLLGHATAAMTKRYAQGAANKSAIASFRRAIG